jgi:diguanylate cyclase (GGDEF)-like protein/PAS domain S-box-containing protein
MEHGRVLMILGVGNKPTPYGDEDVETTQLIANSMWHLVQRDRSLARLRLVDRVLHDTAEGVVITKTTGEIVLVNPAFESISGYSEREVRGKTPRILKSGRHDRAFYAELWSTLLATGIWRGELWNRRKDGTLYPEWLTISAVRDEQHEVTHYVGVFSDISAEKEAQTRIDFLARFDTLTALPNRLSFRERLVQSLADLPERGTSLAVLVIDLDRFKVLNDTLGHARGDQLLRLVATRLAEATPAHGTLARLGGDEFGMLIEHRDDPHATASIALGLIARLATPLPIDGRDLVITGSIGISQSPENGNDADTLMRYAEQAMYDAKRAGRNGFRFFAPEMNERALERMVLEHALRGAVARDELLLMYQPQVNLRDRFLQGVEALVRWRHPELGLVPPNRFIGLAEEIGLIGEIGAWVLQTACRQLAAWDAAGLSVPCIAVNLSIRQLEHDELIETVAAALAQAGLEPQRLELEITESMLIRDPASTRAMLARLKALGVRLAMDDFGTGYSNLAMLKLLSLDRLKIDQSFIRDIGRDSNDESIVTAIIALAGGLGLETIAEGVEEVAQAEYLQRAGVEIVQGYLFGRPMPADDLLAEWSGTGPRNRAPQES